MSFVTIAGRIGRNGDLRQGDEPSKSVVNFSVAEDVGFGDKKRTQWWSCALWGSRAEKLADWLSKGRPVTVVGNPELRLYEKKDKTQGAELTCRVIEVVFQGRGEEMAGDPPQTVAEKSKDVAPADDMPFDDPLPF